MTIDALTTMIKDHGAGYVLQAFSDALECAEGSPPKSLVDDLDTIWERHFGSK